MPSAKRVSGPRFANGSYRIAGLEISCDPDLDQLVDKSQPTPLFPVSVVVRLDPLRNMNHLPMPIQEFRPPSPIPLSTREKTQVARFRAFLSKVHEGPYYTVLGNNVRIDKAAKTPAANRDPFEAMPTYSKKYTKNRQRLPRMNHRTYRMCDSEV